MIYDVTIIGSGPAGLTAATYTSRDSLKTLVLGGRKWGGQLMLTSEVENFPGFSKGILGPELMAAMKSQAERFGSEIKLVNVTGVDFGTRPFTITTDEDNKESYQSRSVIVATGADTVWLGVPGESQLIGRGVSSCAPCDAFFFKGKKVIVVGGGDAAMEEVLTLSKFASEVTIVHRREAFRASKIMIERVQKLSNVKMVFNTTVMEILGEARVSGVRLESTVNGESSTMDTDGVFVAIGHSPNTGIFTDQLELDEKGFIKKQEGMQTSLPGVFVAGDVHDNHYKQAVTAAGYGCQAALEVIKYLQSVESPTFSS